MQIWRQRQQTAVQQAKAFSDGLAHAYTPGDWDQTLPLNYPSPQPLHVPKALPDVPDLPVPHLWSAEREHIPIVPPPQVDHEAERDRLKEQAQLLRKLAKERDEFGEQFFDENDESPELREAFAALGQCSYRTGRCRIANIQVLLAGLDDAPDNEVNEEIDEDRCGRSPYAPWPDKVVCVVSFLHGCALINRLYSRVYSIL
jgi:hypothetical protein